MNIKSFVFLLSLPLLFVGCGRQEQNAYKVMKEKFDQIIGCTEEQVLSRIGAPQNILTTGDIKIYQYKKQLGQKARFQLFTFEQEYKAIYDETDVIFKNGRVIEWKGSARR